MGGIQGEQLTIEAVTQWLRFKVGKKRKNSMHKLLNYMQSLKCLKGGQSKAFPEALIDDRTKRNRLGKVQSGSWFRAVKKIGFSS